MPLLFRSIFDAKTKRLDYKPSMYQGTEPVIDEEILFEKLVNMLIKAIKHEADFQGMILL